jgi:hypothetical protein
VRGPSRRSLAAVTRNSRSPLAGWQPEPAEAKAAHWAGAGPAGGWQAGTHCSEPQALREAWAARSVRARTLVQYFDCGLGPVPAAVLPPGESAAEAPAGEPHGHAGRSGGLRRGRRTESRCHSDSDLPQLSATAPVPLPTNFHGGIGGKMAAVSRAGRGNIYVVF